MADDKQSLIVDEDNSTTTPTGPLTTSTPTTDNNNSEKCSRSVISVFLVFAVVTFSIISMYDQLDSFSVPTFQPVNVTARDIKRCEDSIEPMFVWIPTPSSDPLREGKDYSLIRCDVHYNLPRPKLWAWDTNTTEL